MRKFNLFFVVVAVAISIAPSLSNATNITFTSDGTINNGDIFDSVSVYDTPPNHTTITMYGGSVEYFNTFDESISNIQGGTITKAIHAGNLSTINISAGNLIDKLWVHNDAIINITGGVFPNGWWVIDGSGTINISGGLLNITYTKFYGNHSVNIWGYGFNYDSATDLLTGYLSDDSPFSIKVPSLTGINLIPEPASAFLLGLGIVLARRKLSK
ncbi:MAG: hypothetical protein Q7T18_03780 [Sedimentisphaerales bacterium]|nr:hypothetical protein [Sedimentisphaerales bacterium]